MSIQEIFVPDIGADSADVIEILVQPGQRVNVDDPLLVLESAKASMEVPCTATGTIREIRAKVGDQLKEGDLLLTLALDTAATAPAPVAAPASAAPEAPPVAAPAPSSTATALQTMPVPDIGSDEAEVIEILVQPGQRIEMDTPVVVLESAKASMEVPCTVAGVVTQVLVKLGDKVTQGHALLEISVAQAVPAATATPQASPPAPPVSANASTSAAPAPARLPVPEKSEAATAGKPVHAGPAVRKLARALGVDLAAVAGSGPKRRILKDDVHAWVQQALRTERKATPAAGVGLPPLPDIDFAKFGAVELKPLSKIQKVSAQNLHRAWLHIPHVTQFDEADITELEAFRVAQKDALKAQGLNLTVLGFLVKACAHTLQQLPKFNTSLSKDGENLVWKHYIHIGVAVDTPNGLVVPVIRDADQKSIRDITRELGELSLKAREKKLTPAEMQGACFSISSLGGIGGTAFTPIVNWPEVAILGVSRSAMKPVWDGKEFRPRLMLPLSLSYDHRVIDGADAARFTTQLAKTLADIRQLLL